MSAMRLNKLDCQVVIIGSGLPGSVTALILAKMGFDVVVIDRSSHPRFAIGESSTPITDAYLARIADEFDIPELFPLSTFARTRETYPDLDVGKKRGFSYFWHKRSKPFSFKKDHSGEMVVAASPNDELADSNWLRSDIDCQLVSWFEKYGVQLVDNCHIHSVDPCKNGWEFSVRHNDHKFAIQTRYFIDASGGSALGIRAMGGESLQSQMWTNTSAIFGHFNDLKRWSDFIPQGLQKDYPYRCDEAAVHHLVDDGWMWQLSFESGLTSCGIVQANDRKSRTARAAGLDRQLNRVQAADRFREQLADYPSLSNQFENAKIATPEQGLFHRQRLQHWFDRGSGRNWFALPNTVGFVDPLHSKGLAHALSGIYRFAQIVADDGSQDLSNNSQRVSELAESIQQEIEFLDRLIATCYLSLDSFELFQLATFWYFAAATTFEHRACTQNNFNRSFLLADDAAFREALYSYASKLKSDGHPMAEKQTEMLQLSKKLLNSYDRVGLFNPLIPNMYWNTAAPEDAKSV